MIGFDEILIQLFNLKRYKNIAKILEGDCDQKAELGKDLKESSISRIFNVRALSAESEVLYISFQDILGYMG